MFKKTCLFLLTFLFFCLIDNGEVFAHTSIDDGNATWSNGFSPYDVSSYSWNHRKDLKADKSSYDPESERKLVYDVYNGHTSDSRKEKWRIEWQDFGRGNQPYLVFDGWSVISRYHHHTRTNQATYILAENKKTRAQKMYKAEMTSLDASEDLEYNKRLSGPDSLWNKCGPSVFNKYSSDCNMEYEYVGFKAWLPLNELFPDLYKTHEWRLFIVKRVESRVVYDELKIPYDIDSLKYEKGIVSLSSGVNASRLIMNTTDVLRRTSINDTTTTGTYFTHNKIYTRVSQNETNTAIWFGVRTPEDDNKTRWAASPYWTFGGDQAVLRYVPPAIDIIKVTAERNEMCVGTSQQLSATAVINGETKTYTGKTSYKGYSLSWEYQYNHPVGSLDINTGEFTAKKVGTYEATAYIFDGSDTVAEKSLTIKVIDCGDPSDLTINVDTNMCVGDVQTIKAIVRKGEETYTYYGGEANFYWHYEYDYTSELPISLNKSTGRLEAVKPGSLKIEGYYYDSQRQTWVTNSATVTVTDCNSPDFGINSDGGEVCVNDYTELSVRLTRKDGTTESSLRYEYGLTWSSSPKNAVFLTDDGFVSFKEPGDVTISVEYMDTSLDWFNPSYYTDSVTFTVVDCSGGGGPGGPSNPPAPPPSGCDATISSPSQNGTQSGSYMVSDATGEIKADDRGNERFDVTQGIPTSESLYANALAREYLHKHTYKEMTGKVTYKVPVKVTYKLTWTEKDKDKTVPKEDTVVVEKNYDVERPYFYWIIGNLEVYGLKNARMTNYALPSGSITINPSGYKAPSVTTNVDTNVKSHVAAGTCNPVDLGVKTISGGDKKPSVPNENFQSQADKAVGKNYVRNDRLVFNSNTLMNDSWTLEKAPNPQNIPNPKMINNNVFYRSNMTISSSLQNKANTPSSGDVVYFLVKGVNGGTQTLTQAINGINSVTVHTPVVMYSDATDDKEHDQRTNASNNHSFILDRPFTVYLPTDGQHRSIKGYGYRDYAKYTATKQVQFPFDVYSQDKSAFYPANTWITVPVSTRSVTFHLPVWVPEGEYTIKFRAIAENAPNTVNEERNANLNTGYTNGYNQTMPNHVAFDTIKVDVVGRLYDFRVSDIWDYNWQSVFRTTNNGMMEHTGKYYYVGLKDIDGNPRGNSQPFVLPIHHGSHPAGYKNVAVKPGYLFRFDLKTSGNMWRNNDAIRITPSFYFVDKNGQNRRKVDVYYHTKDEYFVKIGSVKDAVYREVILNETLRNIPAEQLTNTADFYYRNAGQFDFTNLANSLYESAFIRKYQREIAKEPTQTGPYAWQILNWKLRTYIGPTENEVPDNAMVDDKNAIASQQMWYGEYSLPSQIYIVDEGTNIAQYGIGNKLNDESPIFLKDGYLIVNFNIETIRSGDTNNPYLQYIHGEHTNQWQMEGGAKNFTDEYGFSFPVQDGDVLYYHADQSAADDFNSGVSH